MLHNSAGLVTKREFLLGPDQVLETDACEQVMEGGAKPGKTIVLYSLDVRTLTLERETVIYRGPAKVKLAGKTVDAIQIDSVTPTVTSSTYLTPSGLFIKSVQVDGFEERPEPMKQAIARPDLVKDHTEARITGDQPLEASSSLSRFIFEIRGREEVLGRIPSGDNQSVKVVAGAFVVDVHPIRVDPYLATQISEVAAGQEAWLQPELNIPSDTAEFRDLAAKVVGNEKRVGWAIQRIKWHVNQTIRPNLDIEVVRNASEILKTKEGACRDFAEVTVALLRAARSH